MASDDLVERDLALAALVKRVVELYHPAHIYLFGSRARGDDDSDSDYDLMVVVPDDADAARMQSRLFYENLEGLPRSADVVVVTLSNFEGRAAFVRASLPATVVREGKLLYGANPWLVQETRSWLQKAHADLLGASAILEDAPGLTSPATFHAQQAVEKAMKGFLTWHQTPLGKTRHLLEVAKPCWEIDGTMRALLESALPLSDYAAKYWNPRDLVQPSASELLDAVNKAQSVFSAILARLPNEVHPY